MSESVKTRWYKDAVVYQIYPRSFCDSNGDGIGDLKGIISKIPYLKELGINAVWLSPCYSSPNDDNGYDISDYRDIMNEFGTMADWQEMCNLLHKNGIKLVMDLVVNHTSDEHKWFEESKKSKDNEYSDYYIWRDGTGADKKTPPNGWGACFGGSVWEYSKERNQFYLHLFSKKQPDLNWDNPRVRQEVADICEFWLNKGVDGFRCDVITYISKPADLYNAPNGSVVIGPNWHSYIRELSERSWERHDTLIVGEACGANLESAADITNENAHLLDTLFHFEHVAQRLVCKQNQKTTNLTWFKKIMFKWQRLPREAWQAVFYENHDQPRSIPRFAPSGKLREKSAKSLAASLFFQRGTVFVYQGQELGMTNCDFKENEYKDIQAVNQINAIRKNPFGKIAIPFLMRYLAKYSRDHARTPMQWSDEKNAGFTSGEPWIKVNPNYIDINAKEQMQRETSVFNFYKKAICVRKDYIDLIKNGEFIPVDNKSKYIMSYIRKNEDKQLLVVCSLSPKMAKLHLPEQLISTGAKVVLSNTDNIPNFSKTMNIPPCDCIVWEL